MTPEQRQLFDSLTRLQQRTVINLTNGMNRADAYIAAGGRARGNNIRSCVAEIIAKPDVSLLLNELKAAEAERALVTADDLAKRLRMFAGLNQPFDPDDLTNKDRLTAIKMLTDYTGSFDKNKTTVDVGHTTYKPLSLAEFMSGEHNSEDTDT